MRAAPEEIARMNDALSTIHECSTVKRMATGFDFTEGPLQHPDDSLSFINIRCV
jgi:hypothetical protein